MKTIIAAVLIASTCAYADEASLRMEIDLLRKELAETKTHVETLETVTSLLLAGYVADRKQEEHKAQHLPAQQ